MDPLHWVEKHAALTPYALARLAHIPGQDPEALIRIAQKAQASPDTPEGVNLLRRKHPTRVARAWELFDADSDQAERSISCFAAVIGGMPGMHAVPDWFEGLCSDLLAAAGHSHARGQAIADRISAAMNRPIDPTQLPNPFVVTTPDPVHQGLQAHSRLDLSVRVQNLGKNPSNIGPVVGMLGSFLATQEGGLAAAQAFRAYVHQLADADGPRTPAVDSAVSTLLDRFFFMAPTR